MSLITLLVALIWVSLKFPLITLIQWKTYKNLGRSTWGNKKTNPINLHLGPPIHERCMVVYYLTSFGCLQIFILNCGGHWFLSKLIPVDKSLGISLFMTLYLVLLYKYIHVLKSDQMFHSHHIYLRVIVRWIIF